MDVAKPISPWKQVSLGSLASFRNGLNYTKEARDRGGLPIVGVKDFQDRVTLETEGLEELDASQVDCGETTIEKGDILFVRSNGNRELIGRSMFVATKPARPTTYSGFSIRLRFHSNAVHPRFFAYLFRGPVIRNTLSSQGGGTNISNLNQGILANLQVPLAPLPSQRRIASILGAYDDLIEVNRRRIAVLEEMARRLFDEWFVHFRFPGHEGHKMVETEHGRRLPEGWRIAGLHDVSEVSFGYPFRSNRFNTDGIGVPVIRIRDILSGRSDTYSDEPFDDRYNVVDGDLLVGMDGFFHTALWSGGPAALNQRVTRLRPLNGVSQTWLLRAVYSNIKHLEATISGTTVAHLSARDLKAMRVILPPTDILRQADLLLGSSGQSLLNYRHQISRLTASRDLLLPRLISGELPVTAAEDELEKAA